jgi:hypothetical protein
MSGFAAAAAAVAGRGDGRASGWRKERWRRRLLLCVLPWLFAVFVVSSLMIWMPT